MILVYMLNFVRNDSQVSKFNLRHRFLLPILGDDPPLANSIFNFQGSNAFGYWCTWNSSACIQASIVKIIAVPYLGSALCGIVLGRNWALHWGLNFHWNGAIWEKLSNSAVLLYWWGYVSCQDIKMFWSFPVVDQNFLVSRNLSVFSFYFHFVVGCLMPAEFLRSHFFNRFRIKTLVNLRG